MTMFLNIELICIGRFIFGLCCGVFFVARPKMVDETIPVSHLSLFGTATNIFLSAGITLAILLGYILPDDDDTLAQL